MSVRRSVGPSVGPSVCHAFAFRPSRSDECRVYGLVYEVSHWIFVKVDVNVADYREVDVEAGRDEGGSQTKQARLKKRRPLKAFPASFW